MSTEKRIRHELTEIEKTPCDYFSATTVNDNIYRWEAVLKGPKDSPYSGGVFILHIELPVNYPFKPPKISFKTKIYHCNINNEGGICLDILKEQWSPALTISKVLISISSLLNDPNPDDPLMLDIAELYRNDKKLHDKRAKQYTLKYAINQVIDV
jgi:ubiquitin-conjugating enzyme E2 D/E